MRILITGGAGFVGSTLALAFRAQDLGAEVVAFDNLHRRGSERNLPIFRQRGVRFVHGDVRQPADLEDLPGHFDWMIDASAEPSVLAGVDSSPAYAIDTNLRGTLNCLEFCRKRAAGLVFLSTSRVYSMAPLRELGLREGETRFELLAEQREPGVSESGISEAFPTDRARSYYGASKLASELLLQEYAAEAGVRAVINRCGTIAGAGQFGKVDQGVFTLWVAHHYYGKPLRYVGYGGTGKQVRDLLHPHDLYDLIVRQLEAVDHLSGEVFNVGGGVAGSTSLREYTAICRDLSGNDVPLESEVESHVVDVPWYVSDPSKVSAAFGWAPRRGVREIAADVFNWIKQNESELRGLFDQA